MVYSAVIPVPRQLHRSRSFVPRVLMGVSRGTRWPARFINALVKFCKSYIDLPRYRPRSASSEIQFAPSRALFQSLAVSPCRAAYHSIQSPSGFLNHQEVAVELPSSPQQSRTVANSVRHAMMSITRPRRCGFISLDLRQVPGVSKQHG